MRRSLCSLCGGVILVAVIGLGGLTTAMVRAQAPGPAPAAEIWKGVYSASQAENGESTYVAMCSRCHNPDLSGGQIGAQTAPPLGGDKFMQRWESNNIDRLFHTIRETMPRGTPGVLNDDSALGLVAYILKFNGFPAGSVPLAANAPLGDIVFLPKDGVLAKREVGNFAVVETVGCAVEGPNQVWTLTRAAEPVTARPGAFGAGAATAQLGSQTFRLVSVAAFRSDLQTDRAVQIKGLIRKDPDQTLINLTAVAPTGSPCKKLVRSGALIVVLVAVGVCSTAPRAASPQQAAAAASAVPVAQYQAMVTRYCASCHSDRLKAAGLSLENLDLAKLPEHSDVWEKVVRKLDAGMMPPQGSPRPDQATASGFATWLKTGLDREAALRPNPGRALIRRLNRAEYANAVRDLLAVDLDVAGLLPPDDSSYGFDNIADILGSSPVLLESYVNAAAEISAIAVGSAEDTVASSSTYTAPSDTTQIDHVEGLPLGTRGGMLIRHTFPLDGEYLFKVRLWRNNSSSIRGLSQPHDVEITIDGERVFLNTIGTPDDYVALITNPGDAEALIDPRLQVRVNVKAGPHNVGVAFVFKSDAPNETLLRPLLASHDPISIDGVPRVDSVLIGGPFNPSGPGDTPSRRRIFVCRPGTPSTGRAASGATSEASCARRILATLARRAYRRPVNAADLQPLVDFFDRGRRSGGFDAGIGLAVRRLLIDPAFLFRAEANPAGLAAGSVVRVGDIDLASRLSFFLWSSIPDDELLTSASNGTLGDPAVLERQVRRMLADPKASSLAVNFAGQWLLLRNLQQSRPDTQEFPDFDDSLRQGFRQETELLFQHIMREDRSVLELLTADYTFINERLARHYGIPGVYGSQFRRVRVTDEGRKGLLGHGSMLTVTSMPNRTSPVRRGKWILENLLGTPPPPPPPNVPPLKDQAGSEPKTMREQMEAHRANPVCANCHRLMDPLGFALENYDGVGAWRTKDSGTPIDASSQLFDGTKVSGVVGLRQALVAKPDRFVATMTEKMMTYALGRGLGGSDMPAVRRVVADAAAKDYRFSSIVLGVVNSVPFKMRMKPGPEIQNPPATSVAVR